MHGVRVVLGLRYTNRNSVAVEATEADDYEHIWPGANGGSNSPLVQLGSGPLLFANVASRNIVQDEQHVPSIV